MNVRAPALAALLAWCLGALPAPAQAPASSPPPEARTETDAPAMASPATPAETLSDAAPPAPDAAPRPEARETPPEAPRTVAGQDDDRPAAPTGALCGDPTLAGAPLPEIPGRIEGCGVGSPVRVTRAGGLALSQPATLDCRTARTLSAWVRDAVRPVVGARGGGAAGLTVAAHYACRTRNNRPGAKVSEHGRGRAIDISAIRLADGTRITVLDGWGSGRQGRILRRLHEAACGPFGTVLGPESDRFHQDHFHFDTARYRSGSYCR